MRYYVRVIQFKGFRHTVRDREQDDKIVYTTRSALGAKRKADQLNREARDAA